MKTMLTLLAATALTGCTGTIRAIALQAALPAAAGVETRVGANCIRARESGVAASAVPVFRLHNARDVFDATISPLIAGAYVDALGRIRTRTDGVCPQLPPPPPPVEPPVAVEPPAEPPPGR